MNNDKKKLMILGVLALLMVAVGAFTFMGGGAPASPEVLTTKAADAYGEGSEQPATGEDTVEGTEDKPTDGIADADRPESGVLALAPFEPRDPFETPSSVPKTGTAVTPPVAQPTAQMAPIQGNPRPQNPGNEPFSPGQFGGAIGGGNPQNLPPIVVAPTFIVKGIILGNKPMAVFEDAEGNQRLVALGGSVDGDTKVVAIEQGKVTVNHKGKRYSLALQEVARND